MNRIRKAEAKDVGQVYDLYVRTSVACNEPSSARYTARDLLAYATSENSIFLVCIEGGTVAGFLLGFDLSCWCYVDVLVVKDAEKRRGIGSDLIYFLADMNDRWDTIEMCYYTDDPAVRQFFERNGFEFGKTMTRWVSLPAKRETEARIE
jgi:GNAT superfamily N-acetyltransferase